MTKVMTVDVDAEGNVQRKLYAAAKKKLLDAEAVLDAIFKVTGEEKLIPIRKGLLDVVDHMEGKRE